MSAISVRLPESLHEAIRELAQRDNVSINQFIALALAEKVSALWTEEYLSARAQRGSRAKFDAALNQVADVEPDEPDRCATIRTVSDQARGISSASGR